MKTYRELLEELKSMPDDRLDDNVTVYIADMYEFYPIVAGLEVATDKQDVLDPGHRFLTVKL